MLIGQTINVQFGAFGLSDTNLVTPMPQPTNGFGNLSNLSVACRPGFHAV
jgi:hypothetical protein